LIFTIIISKKLSQFFLFSKGGNDFFVHGIKFIRVNFSADLPESASAPRLKRVSEALDVSLVPISPPTRSVHAHVLELLELAVNRQNPATSPENYV